MTVQTLRGPARSLSNPPPPADGAGLSYRFPTNRAPPMKTTLASLLAAPLLLTTAHAHHGQEFFLLYDAKVQAPRHGLLQGNFSFIDEGEDDSLGLSPSLSLGILPRTAFNLRADFADEAGAGWAYRSIEPGFQIDLTPPNPKLPVRFGLSVAYQFAGGSGSHSEGAHDMAGGTVAHVHNDEPAAAHPESAAHSHNATSPAEPSHDHNTHEHSTPVVPSGTDAGPDALTPEEIAAMEAANAAAPAATVPAASPAPVQRPAQRSPKTKTSPASQTENQEHAHQGDSGHSHQGSIHNHDDNLFTARLIFEADLTPGTLLVGNLISVLPEGGSAAWGYAVGLRQRLRPGLSVGVEALGDFDLNKHQEILGAVYWEPLHHVMLKVGVGTGLSAISPDSTIRAGILWMF